MNNKMWAGLLFGIAGLFLIAVLLYNTIVSDYHYNKEVLYSWNLADKTSTLEAKAGYIDTFINNLEKTDLAEYNAIFLKTPDNNIQNNINAIKTLKQRLDEIKGLDPESFAYQTAIQQITAQEQGEAHNMLYTIQGGYNLKNYPLAWGWIFGVTMMIAFMLLFVGILFFTFGCTERETPQTLF